MYSDKIANLERTLAQTKADSIAQEVNINTHLFTVDGLTKNVGKAIRCNRLINSIRQEAKDGNIAAVAQRMIDNNELSVEQMGAILTFAPHWSTTLVPWGEMRNAASLYQVEFIRKADNAVFYKVGHTSRQLSARLSGFKYDKSLYTASVHHQLLFSQKHIAAAEEARLHLANASLRYTGEPFLLNGHTEVYTEPLISNRLQLEISLYALLGISRD